MSRPLALLAIVAATALAAPAAANEFAPGGNAGTLARAFALPALGDATVLADLRTETRWALDFTNEYVSEGNCAVECILLDGETARLRFTHRSGLGQGWDFTFDAALLDTGGGFLDGWIQDWHDTFSLPNGGREQAPENRYQFRYERGGSVLLDETRGARGVSDVTLGVGRRLGARGVLRAMVKLPSGDDGDLLGGNLGGALWIERALRLPPRFAGYVAVGGSFNERADALGSLQNTQVAFGGIGLALPLTPAVRIAAQLFAHSRLYDGSAMTPLARAGMPLTLGLQLRTGPRSWLELGFQEDPSVNGSPDFAVYASIRSQ